LSYSRKDFILLLLKQPKHGRFLIRDYGHGIRGVIQLVRIVEITVSSLKNKKKPFLLGVGDVLLRDITYNNAHSVSTPIPYSRLWIVNPKLEDSGLVASYGVIIRLFIEGSHQHYQHNGKLCQTEQMLKNGSRNSIPS
jgi:hypothetical protein